MDYTEFSNACRSFLPLNRKERFYTGTVLPALLFHRGLRNLYAFLRLIRGFPETANERTTGDSFLFYTEYNLKQSAGARNVGRKMDITSNDTPDLLILALKPEPVLVAIEGKVFAATSRGDMDHQMWRQADIVLHPFARECGLSENSVFHVALVPEKLGLADTPSYQVLNWEVFLRIDLFDVTDNHFYPYLQFALQNYERLVSVRSGAPQTAQGKQTGEQIVKAVQAGNPVWVGRNGGEQAIRADVARGRWQSREYWVNQAKPPKGRPGNWLPGQRFLELVESSE